MDLELRAVTEDEFATWSRQIGRAFHDDNTEENIANWRSISELDRTIAALDGGEIVGTAGAFSFEMALPGGSTLPVAGVTAVSVRATHRRQGVLTRMMAHQLDDVASRGEPIAILTASETPIYGRFGYGLGSQFWNWSIDSEGTVLSTPSRATGTIRMLEKDDAAKVLPGIRERVWRRHPGEVAWSQVWWDDWFKDVKDNREGASERRYAVHESESGEADGYVAWNAKPKWESGMAVGALSIGHLYGFDGDIEAALLSFLLSIDLKKTVAAWGRPVDDPLRWRMADFRRMKVNQVGDHSWVRLLDVERSLSARELGADDRLVVEVADRFRPQSAGAYVIEPGSCRRTDAKPDLVLDIRDLGALYLGGISVTTLVNAGRVEDRTGAAARADRLFRVDRHAVVRDALLIRAATPDDEPFARDCHHRAYRDVVERQFGPWDEERQDAFFAAKWAAERTRVVEVDGVPCGLLDVDDRPDEVVLNEIVVHPDAQGRGIGTGLLRELLARGKPVRLQVLLENAGARRLYERVGFVVTGRTSTHHLMSTHPDV